MKFKSLFNFRESTYHRAFFINALIAGIAAGIIVEYKARDPLKLYHTEKTKGDKVYNIAITIIVATVAGYISYWASRYLVGFGDSVLAR